MMSENENEWVTVNNGKKQFTAEYKNHKRRQAAILKSTLTDYYNDIKNRDTSNMCEFRKCGLIKRSGSNYCERHTCWKCYKAIVKDVGDCISCIDHVCIVPRCYRIRFSDYGGMCFICLSNNQHLVNVDEQKLLDGVMSFLSSPEETISVAQEI